MEIHKLESYLLTCGAYKLNGNFVVTPAVLAILAARIKKELLGSNFKTGR